MMYEGLKGLLYGSQYRKFIDQEMGEIEKKYGLNRVDIQILFYLYRAGEHNCFKDIAEQKFFTKGYISQSLSRLQQMKLVKTLQDREDKRCAHIFLEEKAEEILKEIQVIYDASDELLFSGVTGEEKEIFLKVVRKISDNIKNEISE